MDSIAAVIRRLRRVQARQQSCDKSILSTPQGGPALVHHDLVGHKSQDISVSHLLQNASDAGCELRGTAHWEGDTFVNDYEEEINGKRTKMQRSLD